ncbi:MAG TPA: nucleoside-diphosphate sugar epimerase/dehydratase [Candidatus Binatia bacterium]|nr:nucleoside-diphosphate sugar epimerase/dehydratase [Candidatus Binatia bacterium]
MRFARALKGAVELATLTAAFVLAYLLRFDFALDPADAARLWYALPIAVGAKALALWYFGLFGNWWWRYVGIPDVLRIGAAVTLATIGTTAMTLAAVSGFPRSVLGIDWALSALFLVAITGASRVLREWGVVNESRRAGRPVLIVGAGEAGIRLLNELRRNAQLRLCPLGFVDDDPAKAGGWVQGLRVLGTRHDLPELCVRLRIAEIVIAIPSAGRQQIREIVDVCKATALPIRIVPPTRDILARESGETRLRSVEIEDLLGRPAVQFDTAPVEAALRGQTVLVTGAGGSIGSELCRQVATCKPARIVLLDRYENTLCYLEHELRERCPDVPTTSVIADVSDSTRIAAVFAEHRPQVVFHAAALKHVPLMESNPGEAVRNNVIGTGTVAEFAQRHGVARFVFISTDKAIRPTSVMGCTKRVAELLLQALQGRGGTRFVVVRFGNVLGSEGSVVPVFARQIARGGPVTVTHPDAVRYFMLIPEAVHLVLHAGVRGKGGEIFYLDMGEPVRVLDLAIDMIRLSGYRPYEDIDIQFTGLRAGEKLAEELRADGERLGETNHPGLRVLLNGRPPMWEELEPHMRELARAAGRNDASAVRALLRRIVPEYTGVHPGDVAIVTAAPPTAEMLRSA